MAHQYTFDQIEEYLDGNLSGEEKLEFEREIAADSDLANEIKKHRQTRKLNELYTRNQLKDKVRDIQEQVKADEQPSGGFSMMKIAASLAMLIIAGAAYFYLDSQYSAGKVASRAFEPYPNRFRTMGEEAQGNFAEAMERYDTKNFQQAIEMFRSVPESVPEYLSARFYMGVSYLALDNSTEAVEVLQRVVADESEIYHDAASWYLGLAYIENGEEEKAKEILQEIVREEGYNSDEAQVILKKLESPVRKLPWID